MANVYDHAHNLERALKETDEFKQFEASFREVMESEDARKLYSDFRNLQLSLSEKQSGGKEVTDEELLEGRKLFEALQENELISEFMMIEQKVDLIVQEISAIVTKPLKDVYEDLVKN